jgi:hypothetical protein
MKKLEEFWFKYFSGSTKDDERYNWLRWTWYCFLLSLVLAGVILDCFNRNWRVPIYTFLGLLVIFSGIWIAVWIYQRWRTRHGK